MWFGRASRPCPPRARHASTMWPLSIMSPLFVRLCPPCAHFVSTGPPCFHSSLGLAPGLCPLACGGLGVPFATATGWYNSSFWMVDDHKNCGWDLFAVKASKLDEATLVAWETPAVDRCLLLAKTRLLYFFRRKTVLNFFLLRSATSKSSIASIFHFQSLAGPYENPVRRWVRLREKAELGRRCDN